MDRYICIHGHYYQPPRENPWLEEVELQDGAYPYHDWNERITAECYAPNAASRILDPNGKIIDIVNIYSKTSFNFGPSLLTWLARQKSDVYESILEADRLSMERFSGHGSAIAQAYSHMIMPLANERDRHTQILWGIKDFEKRFRRFPEGMWLPETAADIDTLETLAELGIKFTILSPRQAMRVREKDAPDNWYDVKGEKVDPRMPYLCLLPSGKEINIFFYDGPIAQEISFGTLLKNGELFAKRLVSGFSHHGSTPQIVHIATDGENYGHHKRFGDMALAYCLHFIESNNLAKITNYGEYLEKHPPSHVVEIIDNSSWSCIHGIERWRSDCGCSTGMNHEWNQKWRGPLREAMDTLSIKLAGLFESRASDLFHDPWAARNGYIDAVFDRSVDNVEKFLKEHSLKTLSKEEKTTSLQLLEMQRNSMLMYTSCGWFFDEVSGIETVQIMQYASRALQYAEELSGLALEMDFLELLKSTPSNVYGNAERAYDMFVRPARTNLLRVGAHYSISSLFEEYPEQVEIFCYTAESELYNSTESGRKKLVTGKAVIRSNITLEEMPIIFAVLNLGNHDISGGAEAFTTEEHFSSMQNEMQSLFDHGRTDDITKAMYKHFGKNVFFIWHLFKDEQRKILDQILQLTYEKIEISYRQIYENHYPVMNFFRTLNTRLPKPFSAATEYIINADLKSTFDKDEVDLKKLSSLIDEAVKWSLTIDTTTMNFTVSRWLNTMIERLSREPDNIQLFEMIDETLEILKPLSLKIDIWKAQNLYFSIWEDSYSDMAEKAVHIDNAASRWIDAFKKLGHYLHINLTDNGNGTSS